MRGQIWGCASAGEEKKKKKWTGSANFRETQNHCLFIFPPRSFPPPSRPFPLLLSTSHPPTLNGTWTPSPTTIIIIFSFPPPAPPPPPTSTPLLLPPPPNPYSSPIVPDPRVSRDQGFRKSHAQPEEFSLAVIIRDIPSLLLGGGGGTPPRPHGGTRRVDDGAGAGGIPPAVLAKPTQPLLRPDREPDRLDPPPAEHGRFPRAHEFAARLPVRVDGFLVPDLRPPTSLTRTHPPRHGPSPAGPPTHSKQRSRNPDTARALVQEGDGPEEACALAGRGLGACCAGAGAGRGGPGLQEGGEVCGEGYCDRGVLLLPGKRGGRGGRRGSRGGKSPVQTPKHEHESLCVKGEELPRGLDQGSSSSSSRRRWLLLLWFCHHHHLKYPSSSFSCGIPVAVAPYNIRPKERNPPREQRVRDQETGREREGRDEGGVELGWKGGEAGGVEEGV